ASPGETRTATAIASSASGTRSLRTDSLGMVAPRRAGGTWGSGTGRASKDPSKNRVAPGRQQGITRDGTDSAARPSVSRLAPALALDVEPVQQPVAAGSEDDADAGEERAPAVERVGRGEDLPRRARDRIDRPHAAQDHRGVHQRVDPREPAE